MATMNNVLLIGRTTKDADLKEYEGKIITATFTLACRRDYKNKNNEYDADFVECKIIGEKRAGAAKIIKKGAVLAVTGCITTTHYVNKEGTTVYSTFVKVESFSFVPSQPKKEEKKDSVAEQNGQKLENEIDEQQFMDFTDNLPFS